MLDKDRVLWGGDLLGKSGGIRAGGHLTLSFAWFWDRPDVSSFFSPVSGVGSSNGIVDSSILPLVSSEKWISSTIFKAPGLDASGLTGSLFTASSENKDPIFFALVGQ